MAKGFKRTRIDMPRKKKRHQYYDVGTDSAWEAKLKNSIFQNLEYHPEKIHYVVEHTYTPDWKITTIKDEAPYTIYIEAKGRFRTSEEARKYSAVRQTFVNAELVFLFMDPKTTMPFAKKRKDGSKQLQTEWAEKNGFRWFTEQTINGILKETSCI